MNHLHNEWNVGVPGFAAIQYLGDFVELRNTISRDVALYIGKFDPATPSEVAAMSKFFDTVANVHPERPRPLCVAAVTFCRKPLAPIYLMGLEERSKIVSAFGSVDVVIPIEFESSYELKDACEGISPEHWCSLSNGHFSSLNDIDGYDYYSLNVGLNVRNYPSSAYLIRFLDKYLD